MAAMEAGDALPDPEEAVRFEDLTVDDDLPILERIVRYSRSQIALQRLVHVKMLGETSELAGMADTQQVIVPLLTSLMDDAESVIRQHLAAQLLTVCVVCMIKPSSNEQNTNADRPGFIKAKDYIEHPEWKKDYDERGYELVNQVIVAQMLSKLIADMDVDVRRAAADALTGLSLQIQVNDIPNAILPIPLQLAMDNAAPPPSNAQPGAKKTEAEQQAEEWRMTAANLLAELGGAVAEQGHIQALVTEWATGHLVPAVLQFTTDASFRVRRAAAQALPRILGACDVDTVTEQILPSFESLSKDELYRVRKSTGECLVDMSRSLVILATHQTDEDNQMRLMEARRNILIPIADRLIQDEHKLVRQGMMQFLGPFMASFYPFQNSALDDLLPSTSESDGSNHMGIVAQFFPHATSMVSRLNSSQNAVTTAPTPVLLDPVLEDSRLEIERLQSALPLFLQASRRSAHALRSVRNHRSDQAPPRDDLEAIVNGLLDYFAALAIVQTGDENTDAEMRVYCAYSFPAVVLLLGPENWPGALKTCFFTLLNPSYADEDDEDEEDQEAKQEEKKETEPPLPVKRCLASSLHTVAHILGPEIATSDILSVFCDYFLKDADEAVRLNIIRGFPAFLANLPPEHRPQVFLQWSEIMHGDDCLGAKKRSATNPMVLNWRQRDYLARSLPDLLGLVAPDLIHAHVWPIVTQLVSDSVSLVRDDVLWTVPVLLKAYTPDTAAKWPSDKKFSSKTAVNEMVTWLKENVLKIGANNNVRRSSSGVSDRSSGGNSPANFNDRQLYCRVCGTVGLALRLNEEIRASGKKDLAAALGESFSALFFGGSTAGSKSVEDPPLDMPYQKLSSAEHKFVKKILEEQMLPEALKMKDDHIRNVRVTLLKVLQILPADMKESPAVKPVLQSLQQEVATWESFGDEAAQVIPAPQPQAPPKQESPEKEKKGRTPSPSKKRREKDRSKSVKKERVAEKEAADSGPVDVDEVVVTGSSDEAGDSDDDKKRSSRTRKTKKDAAAEKKKRQNKKSSSKRRVEATVEDEEEAEEEEEEEEQDDSSSSYEEYDRKWKEAGGAGGGKPTIDVEPVASSEHQKVMESEGAPPPISVIVDEKAEAREVHKKYDEKLEMFNETMNQDLNVVADHDEVETENPARVQMIGTFNMVEAPVPEKKPKKSDSSARSRSSQRSRGSKGSSKGSKGRGGSSPMKQRKTFIDPIKEGKEAQAPTLVEKEAVAAGSEDFFDAESLAGWKTVIFEDGPIGLQLEPTASDLACRVYGFMESGNARKSGKIELGDVIVKVNDVVVKSYDETVDLLKRGGRRAVTFRPGAVTDDLEDLEDDDPFGDGDDSGDLTSSEEDEPKKPKKRPSKKKEKPGSRGTKPRRPKKKS